MPRATTRYMCLGCGRFWHMPVLEIKPAKHVCPYCRDMYWIDNIDPNVPAPLTDLQTATCLQCATTQIVETPGDMRWCCGCGNNLSFVDQTFLKLTDIQWEWTKQLKGVQP